MDGAVRENRDFIPGDGPGKRERDREEGRDMKKSKTVWSLILALVMTGALASSLAASGVGAVVWYAKWDPAWDDMMKNPDIEGTSGNYFEMDPSWMYGPTLSLDITDTWKISTTALFGNYEYRSGYTDSTGKKRVFEGKEFKWDSDLTLQYKYSSYMFFFGGLKYQGYKSQTDFVRLGSSDQELSRVSSKAKYYQYGPGLGVGFNLPLWGPTSVVYNINFVAQYATDDQEEDKTADYWVYGINTLLGLAYYSKALDTSFLLGGKYQMFHCKGQDGSDNEKNNGKNDYFYGVIVSAVYNF